jgi:hypothetical protein
MNDLGPDYGTVGDVDDALPKWSGRKNASDKIGA